MGRNFVDVTSEKSRILLIEKLFFLVRFIDDIPSGKDADGKGGGGEGGIPLYGLHGDVNKFEGVALIRVGILGSFCIVLDRVRFSNPQRLTFTQILL